MFLVDETSIQELEKTLPSSLKPIPSTMKLYQLYTSKHGEVVCRVLSCFCSQPSMCDCFRPSSHQLQDTVVTGHTASDTNHLSLPDTSSTMELVGSSEVQQQTTTATHSRKSTHDAFETELTKVTCVDESLIGKYVVVKYDGLPYPGVVVAVDEDDLKVKVMHKVGRNRYFWPMMDDQCWYTVDNIMTLLEKEPEHVTGRHCQIPPQTWEWIEKELEI